MDNRNILRKVDHTLLHPCAGWDQIQATCQDAIDFGAATACIPPGFVAQAREFVQDRLPICTVIGFPNGYATTASKVFEARDAVANGADELDMVIRLGWVKSQQWQQLIDEIAAIKEAAQGRILKVIVETSLLEQAEKREMCRIVAEAGADFIKTSTGFGGGGATFEDIQLFADHLPAGVKIKASGGISSFSDAQRYLDMGVERLGTSRLIAQCKQQPVTGY